MEMVGSGIFGKASETIFSTPEGIKESNIGTALYFKPAVGLQLLRDNILGQERFDFAFRGYIRRWAYKHPTPWDFFRTMENVSGEDLHWFWKSWFVENYKLAQAITDVSYDKNQPANGTIVTVMNLERMAMPLTISYETVSGTTGRLDFPVEIWNNTSEFKVRILVKETLRSVVIDPDKNFPDSRFAK